MGQELKVYDEDALLYRLHSALQESDKEVVFVIGAPVSAPQSDNKGVADVDGVIELIRNRFKNKAAQLKRLDLALSASENKYQAAFDFLSSHAGQDAANLIIKQAVSQALRSTDETDWSKSIAELDEQQLRAIDSNPGLWHMAPAIEALGSLVTSNPQRFGQLLITSNFDPLAEVAIKKAEGSAWRTALASDGTFSTSEADGCQVVHIHGYWHGNDTLHTGRQLLQTRPSLKNDLEKVLSDKIVVVIAYGGWPDIFTASLAQIFENQHAFPEIIWTFFDHEPKLNAYLAETLGPGLEKNRVTLYGGIDCHKFLPALADLWEIEPENSASANEVEGSGGGAASTGKSRGRLFALDPLDCDRPPNFQVWVGREDELRSLESSKAKVVIISGIGGEGKSVLASHYIHNLGEREGGFKVWDWRDCKEQNDRIRTQLGEIIVRFSNAGVSHDDLAEASEEELVELLIELTHDQRAVIVLDNVDSYVDLENQSFTGLLDRLVQNFASSSTLSRLIVTCRPLVNYASSSAITFSLKGITRDEAIELFGKRCGDGEIADEIVDEAHSLTNGHAFWLDLLAVQVSKVPGTTLQGLLTDLRRGRDGGPDVLSSIWEGLPHRERTLLRFMAEAVRPETEHTIQKISSSQLTHKNFSRAIRSLTSLNLIVIKREEDAPDLYDLHPLVRQFVRTKFAPAERTDFIRVVINQYKLIIGSVQSLLGLHMPYSMLERWSQKAELEISASMFEEALETLVDVEDAFIGGGHLEEYVRVARLFFEGIDWEAAPTKYRDFDTLVGITAAALDQLGEYSAADKLIDRYEKTIPQKTARYIKLCDIRTYSNWLRGDFDSAIEWGRKGSALKEETQVDTVYDCQYNLALAQRDGGDPQTALEFFTSDYDIDDVIAGKNAGPGKGPLFGNTGRCLQFLDRNEDALKCYRTSIKLLEKDSSANSRTNRAYARRWIGQVLAKQDEKENAEAFFVDSIRVLGRSAPVRVREIVEEIQALKGKNVDIIAEGVASKLVRDWLA